MIPALESPLKIPKEKKMSTGLCWKCREIMQDSCYKYLIKVLHCHHIEPEAKPKCWCETNSELKQFEYQSKYWSEVFCANYCPHCGRKL